MDNVIYRGGCHYVTCDGVFHTAHYRDREMHKHEDVQCRCFCNDPEFKEHGFSVEMMRRVDAVGQGVQP